jgi:hypothetical protein
MTITLNIPNEQLFEKILWLLSRFKNDGLEIITDRQRSKTVDKTPLSDEEIAKIVKNSQKIEGYEPPSKELELEVEAFMQRHNLEVSA